MLYLKYAIIHITVCDGIVHFEYGFQGHNVSPSQHSSWLLFPTGWLLHIFVESPGFRYIELHGTCPSSQPRHRKASDRTSVTAACVQSSVEWEK